MSYAQGVAELLAEYGVAEATMMKSPCLRYQGDFMCMFFDKADALIIKVSSERVTELIEAGIGLEFNYTKRPFKEWVLIPLAFAEDFPSYMREALDYARNR